MGKIGNKEIIKEDIQSFMKLCKEMDWTSNAIYKGATNSIVEPTFSIEKPKNNNTVSKYDNILNNFIVNDQGILDSYLNFCQELENEEIKKIDKIEINKVRLCSNTGIKSSSIKEEIITNLTNNWKNSVKNSNELSSLLIPYKNYIYSNDYN